MERSTPSIGLVVLLLLAGCKSTEGTSSSSGTGTIERSEIEESGLVFADAHDIVRQLRPGWLIERGISTFARNTGSDTLLDYIAVYVDRNLLGDPGALRRVPAIDVFTIEFYDTARAQRLGSRSHIHGAIVLTTRRR